MNHTFHTYKTSLLSSPLHDQPSLKFWLLHAAVALNESKVYWKWYQTVDYNSIYKYTKLERNQFINIWVQAKN